MKEDRPTTESILTPAARADSSNFEIGSMANVVSEVTQINGNMQDIRDVFIFSIGIALVAVCDLISFWTDLVHPATFFGAR